MSKEKRKLVKQRRLRRLDIDKPLAAALPPVRLNVDRDQCPCGSEKSIRACSCLRSDGRLLPQQVIVGLSGKKTGLSNASCFARDLGDCSKSLSDGTPVGRSIYEHVTSAGIGVSLNGVSWALPAPDEHAAPFICERHNAALEGIEEIGSRFFKFVTDRCSGLIASEAGSGNELIVFNGHDIERWVLKTMIAMGFGFDRGPDGASTWTPDIKWLEILFGNEPFPERWGMYFRGKAGRRIRDTGELGLVALISETGAFGGAFELRSIRGLLLMTMPPRDLIDSMLDGYLYRPDDIILTDGEHHKIIHFGWDQPGTGGAIRIRLEAVRVDHNGRRR